MAFLLQGAQQLGQAVGVLAPPVIPLAPVFDPNAPILQALSHLDVQAVQPFENAQFNINDIETFFANNSNNALLDTAGSRDQFDTLVKGVLDSAFKIQSPFAVQSVLSTLGQAAQGIGASELLDASPIIESALRKAGFPLGRLSGLEGKIFQQVDIPDLIDSVFTPDLERLQARDLSNAEIQSIRSEFKDDLEDLEQEIDDNTEAERAARELEANLPIGRPEEETFLFGVNTLLQLQEYLEAHVENNVLKRLLLSDVQSLLSQKRQEFGIQLGQAPLQIFPKSATSVQVFRDPLRNALVNTLRPEIMKLERTAGLAIRAGGDGMAIQKDLTLDIVRKFNQFVTKNQVKDKDGVLITIPTETRVVGMFGAQVQPVSVIDLMAAINAGLQKLTNPQQSFELVPMTLRDPGTGQTKEQIVQDIQTMDREFKQQAARGRPRPKKTLVSSISKRAGLRNIQTMAGMRRVQMTTLPSGIQIKSHGAKMREVRINKDVTLAELAKLANMLAMENGSLETINELPLLDIVKGQTTIQEIVAALMEVQHMNGGNDYSVLFVPANVFGGMFLDGPMDSIVKNRMLVSPVGGDIFSSIFGAVGNVVKTVASVPLQLAGAVFGGGIGPAVVRADAPQSGGAVHMGQEFQQGGSQQPEPFGTQVIAKPLLTDNQTFHIQPFPFGGRIDNTGFVDESQVNPKFAWGELPVNGLTYFP